MRRILLIVAALVGSSFPLHATAIHPTQELVFPQLVVGGTADRGPAQLRPLLLGFHSREPGAARRPGRGGFP